MKRTLILILLCILPNLVFAAPSVYPVKEAIGFVDPSLAANAPAFSRWISTTGLPGLGQAFSANFKKEFGAVAVDNITEDTRHSTLVASLHLIRASQYSVPKIDGTIEFHLPVTLSIVFTNPDTGEVIYSFTRTSYAAVRALEAQINDEKLFEGAIERNYNELLNGLIRDARKGYDPVQIEATIVKIWKGLYVLDKGTKFGIAKDDTLADSKGFEIQVRYAAEEYAIASQILGEARPGQKFSKYANQSLVNQLKKPKVLTMQKGWEDEQLKAASNFFDSELSKESAFTLLPVNESLSSLLKAVARDTTSGQFEVTNQRTLPDYLMKFTAAKPRTYEVVEPGKFGVLVYDQYLLGELLDKQGRIIYAAIGNNRIEDKNVAGMVFDRQARLEVLLKNAVTMLAEQFSRSIKFAQFVLPVISVNGQVVTLEDVPRQLRGDQNVLFFRNIGRVDGIQGDVFVPIWEATVVDAADGKAKVQLISPLDSELKDTDVSKGDMVLLDAITVGKAGESETGVTYCKGMPSKLGTLPFDDFDVISHGPGHLLPYSLYDNDLEFVSKIRKAITAGGFKDSLNLGKVNTANRCLLPVHKVEYKNNICDKGVCAHDVSFVAGFRLYNGQEVKGKAATSTTIKTEDCLQNCQFSVIQGDLSKNALGLLTDAIQKIRYQ